MDEAIRFWAAVSLLFIAMSQMFSCAEQQDQSRALRDIAHQLERQP